MTLSDDDRWLIKRAREIAPGLRGTAVSVQERLAAELLVGLADLAEHLAGASEIKDSSEEGNRDG